MMNTKNAKVYLLNTRERIIQVMTLVYTIVLLILKVDLPTRWERMINLVNYFHHILLAVVLFYVKGIEVVIYSHLVDRDMP